MQQGTVKFYNDQKGFGFILPLEGSEDLFFHITQCVEGYEPQQDDIVEYNVGEWRDGRPCAQEVAFVSAGEPAAEGEEASADDAE